MPDATISLNQLLGVPEQGFAQGLVKTGMSAPDVSALAAALPGMSWASVESVAHRQLAAELNSINPMDLIAGAWQKYRLLADAAEQTRGGGAVLVPMAEHSISTTAEAYIQLQLGPQTLPRIELELTLKLTLKGLIVRVEAARIRALEAGTCEGSAELGIKNSPFDWKHEIKPIPLPGAMKLGDGIPIAAA